MERGEIRALMEAVADVVREYVESEIATLRAELAEAGKREAAAKEALASFERRLSRHAEHLAKLEDRTKRLLQGDR